MHRELIGTEVGGRYKIVRLIDTGGMGAVYEVVHKLLGRKFAMKTLATHLVGDNDALDRFRREAEVIATLHHPNIIDVIDWEQLASGDPCMVLELLRGENLAARITRAGHLDWPLIATIGDQVLSALEAAHRANIIHRDLKPQNVFLAEDDTGDISVKLLDFGVSKIRNAQSFQTTDDRLLGTPAFMSPEQADGRQVDVGPQTDVWAMGALLFMMATGKPPFPSSSVPQLLYRICHGEPLAIADHRDDAPVAFCELISRALSRDPARRITTARDLRRGLRAALGMATPSIEPADEDEAPADLAQPEAGPVAPASGTITFLLTEIEGSTQLRERHRDTMTESVALYDALLCAEIEQCGGYVFKNVGETIHAAFADPIAAALAATEAQRRLVNTEWGGRPGLRVRMAIHIGPASERDGDYFGPTLHRVARLLALAHGGQILVSAAAEAVLRPELPATYELLELGIYKLKNLSRPEHIHQLVHPELNRQFETLASASRAKSNLPNSLSSFVGRAKEIEAVSGALEKNRLLTITGLGGSGKTRLGLQVASTLGRFGDGVWFVELASLTDGALVPQTIAHAINMVGEGMFAGSEPWIERLKGHLATKRVLLVLDNCEQLAESCGEVASTLLAHCHELRILATSREPLRVPGEVVYSLAPLATGDEIESNVASIAALDSVRLFVERVRLNKPAFVLDEQNAGVVHSICRQLDGLPLAIELAAARMTVLSADAINKRLQDRFSLLRRTDGSIAPRQRSLRAMLDWSYELLTANERCLFARLGVFQGTFGLAGVEAICSGGTVDEAEVLDLLDKLAQKSLLQTALDTGEPRYRLLETVREYAQGKLRESGEDNSVRARHCEWYVELAETAEPQLRGRDQTVTLDMLESDSDNIRGAIAWSLESGSTVYALRLCGALWWFWTIRGHLSEGRYHLQNALAAGTGAEHEGPRARALIGSGFLTVLADPARGSEHFTTGLRLAENNGDARTQALAHCGLGIAAMYANDLIGSLNSLKESRRQCIELGDDWGRGLACMVLGPVAGIGDRAEGEAFAREALASFERAGDSVGTAGTLNNFAEIARTHGDHNLAVELYEQALTLCREVGDMQHTVITLANLGMALTSRGDHRRADECLRQCLRLSVDIGLKMAIPHATLGLAGVALAEGALNRAAQLLGVSVMLKESVAGEFYPPDQAFFETVYFAVRSELDPDTAVAEWKRGGALTPERAIAFALSGGEIEVTANTRLSRLR